jgi:hypothetical protein
LLSGQKNPSPNTTGSRRSRNRASPAGRTPPSWRS